MFTLSRQLYIAGSGSRSEGVLVYCVLSDPRNVNV